MPAKTELTVLSIPAVLSTGHSILHPSLLHDGENVMLVDTGLTGLADQVIAAIEEKGIPLEHLTHIIITHADADHIGNLASIVARCRQKVEIFCHKNEKPYVECDVPPLRLSQMENSLGKLTGKHLEQMTAIVESLRANYKNLRAEVTKTVEDGETLPCGAEVVYTPGHTPGHISLYLRNIKTLIAGDALNVVNGALTLAPAQLAVDPKASKETLQKLSKYDITTAVCYHGGSFNKDVNQKITELLGI